MTANLEYVSAAGQSESVLDETERQMPIVSDLGSRALGAELGPNSLLWRYLGDNRMAFPGLSVGILQLMHPAIGAGVEQHSTFFADPWGRIERSLPKIYGAAYNEDAKATGEQVRDIHLNISGIDHNGKRYHALNPETWLWAHATFLYGTKQVIDRFSHHKLTYVEMEQLYDESNVWYDNWGVSNVPVPKDFKSFKEYWDDTCNDVLEMTPAARQAVDQALDGDVPRPAFVPEEIWPLLKLPLKPTVGDTLGRLAIGGIPQPVRKRLDIPFSRYDQMKLTPIEKAISKTWRFMPDKLRYHPVAYDAFQRTAIQS